MQVHTRDLAGKRGLWRCWSRGNAAENGWRLSYGYVTRKLEAADHQNPYVTGAKLALYDAIRVNQTGDSQDHAFEGVEVTRDRNGNVTDIVVKEGYAGEKLEFSRDRASEKIPGKSRQ